MKAQGWQEVVMPEVLWAEPKGPDGICSLCSSPSCSGDSFPYRLARQCQLEDLCKGREGPGSKAWACGHNEE